MITGFSGGPSPHEVSAIRQAWNGKSAPQAGTKSPPTPSAPGQNPAHDSAREASPDQQFVDHFFRPQGAGDDASDTPRELESTLKRLIEDLRGLRPGENGSGTDTARQYDHSGGSKSDPAATQFVAMA